MSHDFLRSLGPVRDDAGEARIRRRIGLSRSEREATEARIKKLLKEQGEGVAKRAEEAPKPTMGKGRGAKKRQAARLERKERRREARAAAGVEPEARAKADEVARVKAGEAARARAGEAARAKADEVARVKAGEAARARTAEAARAEDVIREEEAAGAAETPTLVGEELKRKEGRELLDTLQEIALDVLGLQDALEEEKVDQPIAQLPQKEKAEGETLEEKTKRLDVEAKRLAEEARRLEEEAREKMRQARLTRFGAAVLQKPSSSPSISQTDSKGTKRPNSALDTRPSVSLEDAMEKLKSIKGRLQILTQGGLRRQEILLHLARLIERGDCPRATVMAEIRTLVFGQDVDTQKTGQICGMPQSRFFACFSEVLRGKKEAERRQIFRSALTLMLRGNREKVEEINGMFSDRALQLIQEGKVHNPCCSIACTAASMSINTPAEFYEVMLKGIAWHIRSFPEGERIGMLHCEEVEARGQVPIERLGLNEAIVKRFCNHCDLTIFKTADNLRELIMGMNTMISCDLSNKDQIREISAMATTLREEQGGQRIGIIMSSGMRSLSVILGEDGRYFYFDSHDEAGKGIAKAQYFNTLQDACESIRKRGDDWKNSNIQIDFVKAKSS